MLTQDQEKAKLELLSFLLSDQKYFVLNGFAGVGKTFLIQHVEVNYKDYLTKYMSAISNQNTLLKDWVYTATTNKAAQSLKEAIQITPTHTIHSLLNLQVKTNYKTGTNYITQPKGVSKIENSVVVIDECSYIDYDLLSYLDEAIASSSKVIFMGDPLQLTPVGLNHCPVFKQGYQTYELTEVVRQTKEHPITDILVSFRKYIKKEQNFFPKIKVCSEIKLVDKYSFEKDVLDYFNQASNGKLLAWRNKTVNQYNISIFAQLNNRSTFNVGDLAINNHAVNGQLKTDQEVEILSVRPDTSLGVSGFSYAVNGLNKIITVFVPSKLSDYNKAKNKAVREGKTQDVYTIMDTWADLRPYYCSTVNKAQGSTYDIVFIDLDDFKPLVKKDPMQLARLLYVAISRAKYQVIFTGDLC